MTRRGYGTGHLYTKSGAYYGRWRTVDGRMLNRKLGAIRAPGTREGLTPQRPPADEILDNLYRRSQRISERADQADVDRRRRCWHGPFEAVMFRYGPGAAA